MAGSSQNSNFVPVTATAPCVVCDKGDWCRRSRDGAVAECHRLDADQCPSGYVFRKKTRGGFSIFRRAEQGGGPSAQGGVGAMQKSKKVWTSPDQFA